MTLKELLAEKRAMILERWLDRTLETYPPDSRKLFREKKSPFSNPIGFTLREGVEKILQELIQPTGSDQTKAILEPVMKVRAVESLPPSKAVGFILSLKKVITEVLGEKEIENLFGQEWFDLNSRIDQMALQAFDLYLECREKVNRLRIKELRIRAAAIPNRRFEV